MPITGGNKVRNGFYRYVADVRENALRDAIDTRKVHRQDRES